MKRSPINRESAKYAKEREQRRALVKALQDAGLWECQIGPVLRHAYVTDKAPVSLGDLDCFDAPSGIHERRKRSANGSLTMLANLMPACSFHNQWVEREPEIAHQLGLVVRPGDADWDLCGMRWE